MCKIDFAFLDSGTGGIPYMLALKEKMPQARCVYLGDTAQFPYGEKSEESVVECASEAVSLIIEKWSPRALVIACNTISVTALSSLRKRFSELKMVGTVPAIKLAAKISKNRRIGLLATNATVSNPYSDKLILDFASDCRVFKLGEPNLVRFVEKNFFTATESERLEACIPARNFFLQHDCDTVVLGCTHFTHIASDFAKAVGNGVSVIDSRDGVANQALRVCSPPFSKEFGEDSIPDCSFFVTKLDFDSCAEYKMLCEKYKIPWGGVV